MAEVRPNSQLPGRLRNGAIRNVVELSMPFFKHLFATATQAEPVPLPRGHIPALDGIRGLAILLVTIYRFAGTHEEGSSPQWLLPVLEFGMHGVDLFFVLSGFLITGILFDAKGES